LQCLWVREVELISDKKADLGRCNAVSNRRKQMPAAHLNVAYS
jgi:hypothetical protein